MARTVLGSGFVLLATAAHSVGQVVPRPYHQHVGDPWIEVASIEVRHDAFRPHAEALATALQRAGWQPGKAESGARLVFDARPADEETEAWRDLERYELAFGQEADELVVRASAGPGAARAAATLCQLARIRNGVVSWPSMTVFDRPDHRFRCFMVDMGRNPHSPATLRRVVDAAWFCKLNYVQLHLSDDQLFSWPSKTFPKLHDARSGWTWQDFVDLEAYAAARGIGLIPELDVPAHSTILRQRYPEVFGKTPTELATLDSAQRGVEALIDEFLSVFESSPFVHVGGDEAYGVDTRVQRRFLNRLQQFVASRGKRMLAWEGPPLGEGDHKLDTEVWLMNWRTVSFPAPQMLEAGYTVVHATWDPLYIVDHYPRTMFTCVDLERCFGWDPTRFAHVNHDMRTFAAPDVVASTASIAGFCMPWWEGREENLLPLCVPRLAATGAAAWNRQGEADYADFAKRWAALKPRLEAVLEYRFPELPFAEDATQVGNLAFRKPVSVSTGGEQPHFGPQRLTNGITSRFDHFLGFPTKPSPLQIDVDLGKSEDIARIVVHETAVGKSHEVYRVSVSTDGQEFLPVGEAGEGSRGEQSFVEHRFETRPARWVRIETQGCHGLTFPSFSRLTEIEVFAR